MEWFHRAAQLLGTIKGDPARLDAVLELQQLLVRRIARAERSHGRLSSARLRLKAYLVRERVIGERAYALRKLVLAIQERFDELEHLRFLYRCFGDGLVAIYQSPVHHRHFYFGERAFAKERARRLRANAAFRRDYRALRLGIGMGLPVVLADLTNLVGQGDVCLLAGREPQPMDLKPFAVRGSRGRIHAPALRHAMALLAGTGPGDFRGAGGSAAVAQRLEIHLEAPHRAQLNDCLQRAMAGGVAEVLAEPGLRYVAVRTDYLRDHPGCLQALRGGPSRSTMSVQLEPGMSWVPMVPFTQSMSAANAVLFMQGAFQLLVLVDLQVLKSHFASLGVHAVALMDGVTAFQISRDPDDLVHGVYRVSEAIFQRLPCEFIGLRGFAEEVAALLEPAQAGALHEGDDRGLLFPPPADWSEARDYYDEDGPSFH